MAYDIPQYSTDELVTYIQKNRLLTSGINNVKLAKSYGYGYLVYNLSLMPWKYSGYQTCPNGQSCHADCIGHKSGNNVFKTTQIAKIKRTQAFFKVRDEFMRVLQEDLDKASIRTIDTSIVVACRLNTYSDIQWESVAVTNTDNFIDRNYGTMFYDYTKLFSRVSVRACKRSNYDLTYSLSAQRHNMEHINDIARYQRCALVVSRDIYKKVKQNFSSDERFNRNGLNYYNGEEHDLTFIWPKNGVLVLKEKYVKTPQEPSPLVYRSLESIGL
jgi:hypothetical protein